MTIIREPVVSYSTFVKLTYETATAFYTNGTGSSGAFFENLRTFAQIDSLEIFCLVSFSLLWTVLRLGLTNVIFIPICLSCKLPPNGRRKAPESMWKLFFYFGLWAYSFYVIIQSGKYSYFSDPMSVWDNWRPSMRVPSDIRIMYLMQASFYMHSFYATLALDEWRSDSWMMVVHHIVTLSLISFSYVVRCHAIGALIMFLHDLSDVLLEFAKLNSYFKKRKDGKFHRLHDVLANIAFVAFMISWFVFRLYWFPLKTLYASFYGVHARVAQIMPFGIQFNLLLFTLLGMNIYWFYLIILVPYRVITGKARELDDIRESDLVKDPSVSANGKASVVHGGHVSNGVASVETKHRKRD